MNSKAEQERARRVSDYADSLLVRRRTHDDDRNAVVAGSDREFPRLAKLAAMLAAVRVEPPPRTEVDVARRVRELAEQPLPNQVGRLWVRWRERCRMQRIHALQMLRRAIVRPLTIAAVNLLVIIVALAFVRSPNASAAEILARTDAALVNLIQPGKMLFRRWRIVDRILDRPGAPERVVHRLLLEWVDGTDIRHATGKSVSSTGRTYLAYACVIEDGRPVPRMYYEPGYANEPLGLVSLIPSREQFAQALTRFTGAERRILDTYLSRGYIYEPILSELRFNQAMLRDVTGIEPLQRFRLSVDSATLDGHPVYKVRSTDDVRMQFRWRSKGPPVVWLERQETVRYISRVTYLAVRSEETHLDETGARIETTRELVESRNLVLPTDGESPFDLSIPAGVPVRRQSAYDHLVEVLRALGRAPRFLSEIEEIR
jgi:hypothetical protein